MTQGRFSVKNHAQIQIHVWLFLKMLGPFDIPHIGATQEPIYELSPIKKVLLGKRPFGTRRFKLITPAWRERQAGLCYWFVKNPVIYHKEIKVSIVNGLADLLTGFNKTRFNKQSLDIIDFWYFRFILKCIKSNFICNLI